MDAELLDAITEAEVTRQARRHYQETDSYQANLRSRYDTAHRRVYPINGDQWPEDTVLRPGMIHVSANILKPALETEARLESLLPRVTNVPDVPSEEMRHRAEAAEKLMLRFLELSGWEIWLTDLTKIKGLYSKGVLKVFWNKAEARPDVSLVENPANLRVGWGTNDFRVIDWTLYEYAISAAEATRRYPEITITPTGGERGKLQVARTGKHDDPLGNVYPTTPGLPDKPIGYVPTEYENRQLPCWDYWYKDSKGVVKNAIFVQGVLVKSIETHSYLPDIPYIIIEHSHEPGSPEGVNLIDDLWDIQVEINRALSHWAQLVADEIDPAWQVSSDSWAAGTVPKGGEIIPAGEGKTITSLAKPVSGVPLQQLLAELYKTFHFVSGLAEILFALPPGAQTAGKALAIQIESSSNRLDPRRRRLYRGLYEVLLFWTYMIVKVNPKVQVGVDDLGKPKKAGLREMVEGLTRWKFVAPEITPRDVQEAIVGVMNKVQAKLVSLETGMDELGVDAPLDEIRKIMGERTNPALFPGDAQAYAAVMDLLRNMMQAEQAPPPGAGPGGPTPQQDAMGQLKAAQQAAQPTMPNQDMPQPASVAGGLPTAGGPQLSNTTLIRSGAGNSGQAQALQQVKIG